ncbi:MAG: 16S rRNA (cytosine(1402)-N(4))-methyltransferase RsmH [Terriglobia bacterium]
MHVPVLAKEALEFLDVRPDGVYIDATLGSGGHAEAIVGRLESGKVLAIDRDPAAITLARERLGSSAGTLIAALGNFAEIDAIHAATGLPLAAGVLADLGISSGQLEDAARGFSFGLPGPLDMRMDQDDAETAADLVNRTGEHELADLIFQLGEERHSRRIARAIVRARPIRTTTELAQVVTRAIPARAGPRHLHPATRTFMALRMAVNHELENLELFLQKALSVLAPGGRVVVVSFHSLEDRRVKQAFRAWQDSGTARILTRKPVRPGEEELRANPRSRSAKLRAAEKA